MHLVLATRSSNVGKSPRSLLLMALPRSAVSVAQWYCVTAENSGNDVDSRHEVAS